MREETKRRGRKLLRPVVNLLVSIRVPPNLVTLVAIPLSLGAGVLLAYGRFIWGGVLVALVGLCDTLDGEMARATGTTRTGAFLDSVVDRLGEAAVFCGLAWYYARVSTFYAFLAVLALVFSLLVSYVRARAEGAGFECRIGWFERPVRVLTLLFSLFVLGRTWAVAGLAVIAVGSLSTFLQRVFYVLSQRYDPGR